MEYNKWTTLNCLTNELLNEFHFLAMCAVWNFFYTSSMHHISIILWVISCTILLWLLLSFFYLRYSRQSLLIFSRERMERNVKSFGKRNTWCRLAIDDGHGTRNCSHNVSWYCSAFNYLLWDNFHPNSIDWIPWFEKMNFLLWII